MPFVTGKDVSDIFLLFLAFIVTMGATNFLIYIWNSLISTMAMIISSIINYTEPVPECIEQEKRMVYGSLVQLLILLAVFAVSHLQIAKLYQFRFLLLCETLCLEGKFMFRLGTSLCTFITGPSPNAEPCEIT